MVSSQIASKMFLLYALTPLHVGVGRVEGAHVDLPVQRDEFGMPVIWASSLKGALKSWVKAKAKDKNDQDGEKIIKKIFGGDPGEPDSPSHVSLFDARLLLIPARSSKGIWLYVTSPHLLRLYKTNLETLAAYLRLSVQQPTQQTTTRPQPCEPPQIDPNSLRDKLYISSGLEGEVYINEIKLNGKKDDKKDDKLVEFKECLANKLKLFDKDIVVVSDDVFDKLIRRSMLVQYRVRLTKNKTVASGALWSEEYLPQFTVLHSAVVCKDKTLCEDLEKYIPNETVFWAGGKETIGKGLLKLVYL
ncbi:MAG: type III-B CRISPR module RAMP protein Cmr4 [Pyrobaculum sp.]